MADVNRILADTENFLTRQLGSRAAREANKRRLKRGVGEAARRARRAALIFVGLLLVLLLWSLASGSVGFWTWIAALPIIFLTALVSLFFPTRCSREAVSLDTRAIAPLDRLAARCEDWLIGQARDLPRPALPAADAILARLEDMRPHLAALPEHSPQSGQIRRLIGEHLPMLVDSYTALPPEKRAPEAEATRRFTESLQVVRDELTRLCTEIAGCKISSFETQTRFIESRYKDPGAVSLE